MTIVFEVFEDQLKVHCDLDEYATNIEGVIL